MPEVIIFNHIPKTAGSTLKNVLWRTVGSDRVLFSMAIGLHGERLAAIRERLERPDERPIAIVAHTGAGIEARLPPGHTYVPFTILRDPVQRTISAFFYARDDRGNLPGDMSVSEFLETQPELSFNSQTAFIGGLTLRRHLDDERLARDQFDRALLEKAKLNLESQAVVGLTERFDETLLLLGDTYRWPVHKMLYRPDNLGKARHRHTISPDDLEAIEASNELDIELYAHAQALFEKSLSQRIPDHARRLRRFERLNDIYRHAYPVAFPPARAVLSRMRSLRGQW